MKNFWLIALMSVIGCALAGAESDSSAWLNQLERIEAERRAANKPQPRSMLTGGSFTSAWQPGTWWGIPAPWLPAQPEQPFYFLNNHFYQWDKNAVTTGLPLGVDPAELRFPTGDVANAMPKKVELKRYELRNNHTPLQVAPVNAVERAKLKQYELKSPYTPPPRINPIRPLGIPPPGPGRLR
ncbi:MAG: hypothetical protein AB7F32_13725 [Victivallaceae bacterium]